MRRLGFASSARAPTDGADTTIAARHRAKNVICSPGVPLGRSRIAQRFHRWESALRGNAEVRLGTKDELVFGGSRTDYASAEVVRPIIGPPHNLSRSRWEQAH